MYHLRKLKSLLLLLCFAVTAQAQLSNGKVYNFVNVGNPGKSMTSATAGNYLSIATTDEADYSQLWYCASDGNGVTLRNLGNGNYLRSPNAGGNTNWTLVKTVDGDNCRFSCTQESGHDVLRAINATDSYHYMHYGATTGTVVCWTSSAPATQWDFTEVSGITSDELNANWESLAAINPSDAVVATYQTALDNLFSDKACTTLKKAFANEDAVKNDADYKALPTTLQQMVLKVYKNSWAEDNLGGKPAWDADYAKKSRVQLYEPYNEPEAAAAALGLNAHTNLNNPTGIFSGGREAMYVMVEGEIEEGASLYLASYSGHGKLGGYQNGVELKPGLNVVPSYFAGNNYCINYVVHTFNTEGGTKKGNKAKARKLSDYEDLKIHIEGGHINGYWNKMGDDLYTPDKNADWDYIAARATQTDVTVLGEYITLQFPLHEALNSDGGTEQGLDYYYTGKNIIESSIQEWDNVMMWERIVLGVLDKTTTEDAAKNPKSPYAVAPNVFAYIGDDTDGFASGYDDYYNVHGLSFGTPSGYMYGGWDHCGYHFNTMGAIMTTMITDAGSHWGPAHEIGHQHQGLLTVNGLTEVTNNLFSNVVLWYYGKTTSRVNGSALEPIAEMFANEEADFFNTTSNVFITTQMYYKLFLYYHVLGHNPEFYPKLFEMLRQDPMSTGYNQRGATSILHFYKKCCEAAGEDLTEFFRAYGFFRVMTNRLVGDYANSVYDQTQEDIDNAIAEVKALAETKGWEENIAVLFINDDTGGQILSHRSDTEYLTPFESADSELGSYATYSDVTAPNYTYTIVGTTVTMEGEGGIGFAIFNEKGELIGFSDNKTFEVSVECAEAIASGKAEVKTMKGDNEAVEAVNIMDTDDTDAKRAMLGELVESAKAVLDLSDEDGTKVGFYRASYLEALESAYTQAKQVYEARAVASYSAVYNALFHEYFEVMNDSYARIGLVEGNAYRLTNKNYPVRSLSIPTDSVNKQMMGEITDTESPYDQQLWYFEASETEGSYYLKNKNTSTYPGNVETSTFIYATATSTSDAHAYKLRDMGNGLWALEGNTALHLGAANYKYGVLGWGADATASQWYITAVDVNENAEALFSLQGMIEKTKDLAGEMANVQYSGKLALQAVSESEPYYLSTNACHNTLNNASDGQGLAGLLDDDTETFFHSDYGGKISNTHYLQVDLGSGNTMSKFAFNYTTRSNGNNCPTEIVVAGSHSPDGTFTPLQTYTATNDGLPNGNALSWESPVIENTGNYRYLRFSVTATENSQKYFVMSTFGITNHETVVKSIEEKYSTAGLTEQTLKNLGEKLFDANELMASDAATSADLQTMCSSIEESYYTPLLAIYNNANAARLIALKEELAALIGKTTDLIGECGTVNYTPGKFYDKAPLQTTNSEGDFYVWTNAQSTQEVKDYEPQRGYLVNLFDGNNETYFHSDYSGANSTDGEDHHITIKLGENNKTSKFKFKYITRHDAETNYPATIEVLGSVDGLSFEPIDTITTGLPTGNTKTYESGYIEANEYYSHLRFMVTANNNNNLQGGHPIFHMAEFELAIEGLPESYTAELKPEAGDAGTDLLIETFKQNAEAQGVNKYATTELQVEAAIVKLQAQYDILETAKNAVRYVDFTINANVTGGGVTYNEVEHTETLRAPSTFTVGDLTAMPVDGYVAKSVTINGTTISVVYNKVYTVTITGGEGEGRVTFGDDEYANDGTFDALQNSFTAANLTATDVEGYTKSEVTVNHETGVISVTYTLDKSALNTLLGETLELIYACNGFVNSAFVTTELLNEANAAWTTAQNALETVQTRNELSDALNDLQAAHDKLNAAKTSAEQEAAERTELNGQLNTLIAETETLIASCYENEVLKFINSEFVTEETISAVRTLIEAAEVKCSTPGTTATEYNTSITALTEAKNNLTTAIDNAKEEAVQRVHLKAELQALVDNTNTLMALCGEIRTAPVTTLSGAVGLQTNQPANNFYLSTNAQESTEGPIAGLTDDDASTFFHSSWMARMNEAHYLQVDMGEQYALKEFAFGYVTRDNEGGGPHPSTIVVSGSNSKDEDSFVELSVINSGLPTGGNISWSTTENVVTPKMPYRYLRFTVTQSAGTNGCKHSNPDEYFFTMSKFSLTAVPTEATPYADVNEKAGVVTETQLLEVYYEKESAQSIINSANNTELTAAKEALQAKYDALNLAYTTVNKSELEALLPEVEALINSCYTDETFNYTGSLYVTTELMEEVNGVVTAARNALDNTVSQDVYDAALADLKNAQAKLQYAVDHVWLPVILTTNIEEPVLYTLKSKRGDGKTLQYDPSDNHMFSIADESAGSVKQIFFFIEGDAATQVYVYPFAAGEQVLAAVDLSAGKEKVIAADMITAEAIVMQWTFEEEIIEGTAWYSLDGVEAPYFSNHGGSSNKMGFHTSKDDGSRFQFVEVDESTIEGSAAYHSLNIYKEEVAKVASSEIVGGNNPGYYPEEQAIAYNAAYANAITLLADEASYEENLAAYKVLKTANEALELNMPSADKFYRFVSVVKGDGSNAYVYANPADNKLYWSTDKATTDATAIWKITPSATDGMYNISNLHTGSNINEFIYYDPSPLNEVAGNIEIESLSFNDGQVGLKSNGTMMHAQGGGAIVHWGTGANDGSAWRIVEVEDMSLVNFALNISQYEHAGLYLNYPVSIPDDVKAYYLDGSKISINDEGVGTLNLTEIEDEVIPARTAVILYAPHGNQTVGYDFVYAAAPNYKYEDNLFTGSSYQTYREAVENHYYYVFGQNKGEIGLYKNGVKYKYNDEGAIEEVTEGATHYKMSANKILFDWSNNTTATMVKSFRFRLGTGGQTTSLEDALMMDNAIIYDLYGRRILDVKVSGLYIVDGVKRYVEVK